MSDDTNPKDAAGRAKLPLHLWPASATAFGAIGLYEGMLKYGRLNWRGTEVASSVYVAALMRHVNAWMECEDLTAEGTPHLCNALASLAIIVDALVNGTLVDDRNYVPNPETHGIAMASLQESMRKLEAKFGGVNPKHWDKRVKDEQDDSAFLNTMANNIAQPDAPTEGTEVQCPCPRCSLERALQAVLPPGMEVKLLTEDEMQAVQESKDKPKR